MARSNSPSPFPQKISASSSSYNWRTAVLHLHPLIARLLQRIDPVQRALALAHTLHQYHIPHMVDHIHPSSSSPSLHPRPHLLHDTTVTRLILHHLQSIGCVHSAEVLATESGLTADASLPEGDPGTSTPITHTASYLHDAVYRSVMHSEYVYEHAVASIHNHNDDASIPTGSGVRYYGGNDLRDPDTNHKGGDVLMSMLYSDRDSSGGRTPRDGRGHPSGDDAVVEEEEYGPGDRLVAASLPRLVQGLCDPGCADDGDDAEERDRFTRVFLITYPTFAQPVRIIQMLQQVFHDTRTEEERRRRIIHVLEEWIRYGVWGRTQDVLHLVLSMIHTCLLKDPLLAPDGIRLQHHVERYLQQPSGDQVNGTAAYGEEEETGDEDEKEEQEDYLAFEEEQAMGDHLGMDVVRNAEQVARQLTLIQHRNFSAIPVHELLSTDWSQPSKKHRAPNVTHSIDYFNRLSLWLAIVIVSPISVRERSLRFEAVVKIGTWLKRMNNFAGLQAVIGALTHRAVVPLTETMKAVSSRSHHLVESFQKFMGSNGSLREYRRVLANTSPPAVPYLGQYMSDLIHIEEGNPDKIDGRINWYKREMIAHIVENVQHFQSIPYHFSVVHRVQLPLLLMPGYMTEKELFHLSRERN